MFQISYANMYNAERAKRWRAELSTLVNTSNMNSNVSQELEIDAFAFTKHFFETNEGLIVNHLNTSYEKVISKYIDICTEMFIGRILTFETKKNSIHKICVAKLEGGNDNAIYCFE